MGRSSRLPDPFDALKAQAPRTGPPTVNMGGLPPLPPPPLGPRLTTPPSTVTPPPGPTGQAKPFSIDDLMKNLPPMPPVGAAPAGPPGYAPPTPPTPAPQPQAVVAPQPAPAPAAAPAAAPAVPPPAPPTAGYSVVGSLTRPPTSEELVTLGSGRGYTTPVGDVYRDASGALQLKLNDQGKAAYEAARMKKLQAFGDYPGKDDPESPAPPIEPGVPSFNPFAAAGKGWVM